MRLSPFLNLKTVRVGSLLSWDVNSTRTSDSWFVLSSTKAFTLVLKPWARIFSTTNMNMNFYMIITLKSAFKHFKNKKVSFTAEWLRLSQRRHKTSLDVIRCLKTSYDASQDVLRRPKSLRTSFDVYQIVINRVLHTIGQITVSNLSQFREKNLKKD